MKHRFTWIELLVVVVIIAVSLVILIPFLNSHREAQRRAACLNNAKQIGQAFQNYASTFSINFPPSAQIITASDGTKGTVGGFSFLVRLYLFMDCEPVNRSVPLHLPRGIDLEDLSDQTIATPEVVTFRASLAFRAIDDMMNTQISEFVCPSGPRGSSRPASAAQQTAGITNYKAMGATTRGSLIMVVNPQAPPPYGTAPLHPDGAIFPGTGTRCADILDGLSKTIITIETIDEAASRWMVGREATLVGMPQKSSPTGTTPQAPHTFFVQPGFDNTYGPDSAVARAGLRTFLSYDFSPRGADAGKYEDPGFGRTPPTYGPSSGHPAVVVCGMGDGSAQSLSKQIDAAALFFLITKNNADPFYDPVQ